MTSRQQAMADELLRAMAMSEVVRVRAGDCLTIEPEGHLELGPGAVIRALKEGSFVIEVPRATVGPVILPSSHNDEPVLPGEEK